MDNLKASTWNASALLDAAAAPSTSESKSLDISLTPGTPHTSNNMRYRNGWSLGREDESRHAEKNQSALAR